MGRAPPAASGWAAGGSAGAPPLSVQLLQDAEAALQTFRAHHWSASKARRREALKEQLNEACAQAKEVGGLVARKRQRVQQLKAELADAEGAAADELRGLLQLDTARAKDGVQNLKEQLCQPAQQHAWCVQGP